MASRNFFAALDDDDAPKFALAPSMLLGGGASVGAGPDAASARPASDVGASSSSSAAAPTSSSSSSSALSMDLATMASEILGEAARLPAPAAAAAWDFSGLADTAAAEAARSSREVEDRQRAHEARLAALASDEALLRERMGGRSDMARGAKKRKADAAGRGEAHGGRLESKVFKRAQSAKARNKAKGMW